ncbi:MAG TPA: BMP family ABC transporter substrate-binding protein [Gaiellaceae bacterium]|nr:BMP family ABC transporter substrate-binding protein [Gaiellaceae bacterium]
MVTRRSPAPRLTPAGAPPRWQRSLARRSEVWPARLDHLRFARAAVLLALHGSGGDNLNRLVPHERGRYSDASDSWQGAAASGSPPSFSRRPDHACPTCGVQSIGQDGTGLVSERRLRVGLVTEPSGIENPYIHGAYLGLERAVRELGIRGRVLTPAPKEGFGPSLSLLARQKYDLVIGFGFFAAAAIDRVATGFPETRFATIDFAHDDLAHRPTNVVGLMFREEQAGYLAGHLAALVLTLSPGEEVISSVGGQRVPAVERFIAGYQAGARGANPRVTTLNSYTDDFHDPVKGRSVALSQIAKGSRVVFQVASACGLGALEAAGERGIWGIGVDVDQSHLGRHILTSAVKRLDVAVFDTVEELVRGTLETGRTSRFSLRNRGVGLGTISAAVPPSFIAEIEDVRAKLVDGKIPLASSVNRVRST